MTLALFTCAIFASALLLFLVQPMFAKMVLPLLGGSPQVWNICMVFFQAALLAGYAYAHWSVRWLGVSRQRWLHLAVMAAPLAVLPIGLAPGVVPPASDDPVPWLLGVLLLGVGLPLLAVATTGPLLQRWFAASGHQHAHDPYFLYAASNVGSMLGLLAYPLVLEPLLGTTSQSRAWAWGYALLLTLVALSALRTSRLTPIGAGSLPPTPPGAALPGTVPAAGPISAGRAARWIAFAFVPSSLMLGVTTHVTTDVAAVPLLWVIPLALYLLTFTLVFARRTLLPHAAMVRVLPALVLILALLLVSRTTSPVWLVLPLHLLGFFVAAMVCHGELARDRPTVEHLTTFYLLMAVGGVLGGAFNALLSPLLFDMIAEYPIALVLACLLCPPRDRAQRNGAQRALLLALIPGMLVLALAPIVESLLPASASGVDRANPLSTILVIATPLIGCYLLVQRPRAFALALGAWFVAGTIVYERSGGELLLVERSFFGVHRASYHPEHDAHLLRHGFTVHGMQKRAPELHHVATTYYHASGPAGQVFAARARELEHVGLVGLGVGTLAAFAPPGARFTFFEIDPVVAAIAENTTLFSYLADARVRGAEVAIRLGDARLTLAHEPDSGFDLLLIDAFSSASVPLHLLTREALALYLSKLRPNGLLLFHVSNNHLDVATALARLADDAGVLALYQDNQIESEQERNEGKLASQWVLMTRTSQPLAGLIRHPARWWEMRADGASVWSDDYSNIVELLWWSARRGGS